MLLTCILACLLVHSIDSISQSPLCSIKGSVLGRRHRERTGGRFQSAGAVLGDLPTAARVAKSPWQQASRSLRHCHPLHSHSLSWTKGAHVPPEGFDINAGAAFSTRCLHFWSILEFCSGFQASLKSQGSN